MSFRPQTPKDKKTALLEIEVVSLEEDVWALEAELARLRDENEALASNLRGKHATTGATYAHLIAERDSLRAENEALRADAERLDWIQKNARCDPKMDGHHVWWPTSFNKTVKGPTIRAAIDAAMREGK